MVIHRFSLDTAFELREVCIANTQIPGECPRLPYLLHYSIHLICGLLFAICISLRALETPWLCSEVGTNP